MLSREMIWRCAGTFALALLAACSASPAPDPVDRRTFVHDRLGIAFALPHDWEEVGAPMASIFSGPPGGDTYYTTIALQARSLPNPKLDAALAEQMQAVQNLPRFAWHDHTLLWIDGRLAVGYTVQFELHETLRCKTGLLFGQGDAVVDLSYNAPADLFALSIATYQDVLDSLTVAKLPGAPRHL
jgi:hypothetical protein